MEAHRCSVRLAGPWGLALLLRAARDCQQDSTMPNLAFPAVSRDPLRRPCAVPTTACSGEGPITEGPSFLSRHIRIKPGRPTNAAGMEGI
jgi:hypothetical protein